MTIRVSPTKPHRYVAVGVAVVSSSVIAVTPITAQPPDVYRRDVLLTAQDIVMDIVRHGEDASPSNELVPFYGGFPVYGRFPGLGLSAAGQIQASDTANQLATELGIPGGSPAAGFPDGGVAGIFSGPDIDAQQTAAPFAMLEGITPQLLTGLTEVDGGVYTGLPVLSPAGILYGLSTFLWTLGLGTALPIPGAVDFNGLKVLDGFNDAVDTIYADAVTNPVVSANGQITEGVFSSSASTLVWVFNTVKNPDILVLLKGLFSPDAQGVPQPLPYAGIVEVQGNPEDGWTLVDWAGQPVPEDMGFVGDLFLLWRELVLPPQLATLALFEAVLSGDLTTIGTAIQHGMDDVGGALAQVPDLTFNVIQDVFTGSFGL